MKSVTMIPYLVGASLWLAAAIAAAQPPQPPWSTHETLVLLSDIPAVAAEREGRIVVLQGPHAQSCRYFGVLVRADTPDAAPIDNLLALEPGSSARWEISIKRQVCGTVVRHVSMTVQLPPLWANGYGPGLQVLAR